MPCPDCYYLEAAFSDSCTLILAPDGTGATGVSPADFSTVIGADLLHWQDLTGQGTVADQTLVSPLSKPSEKLDPEYTKVPSLS